MNDLLLTFLSPLDTRSTLARSRSPSEATMKRRSQWTKPTEILRPCLSGALVTWMDLPPVPIAVYSVYT